MRSKAIFMALLAFAFGAQGGQISSSDAVTAVRRWVRSGTVLGSRVGVVVDQSRVRTRSFDNGASFHEIPLVGGGAVYASSDDESEPILAFVPGGKGELSEQSPLYALLKSAVLIRARTKAIREMAAKRNRPKGVTAEDIAAMNAAAFAAQRKWASLRATGDAKTASEPPIKEGEEARKHLSDIRVAPLLTTRWSQGEGMYDLYTPMVKGKSGSEHAPCGCTATAASQILFYFRYPEALSELLTVECKVDGVATNLTTLASPDDETLPRPYDWDGMAANDYDAISHLTYDVGVALGSAYSADETTAFPYDTAKMYVGAFGYSNAYVYWDDVSYRTGSGGLHARGLRERTIYANLDAKRPVQLGIYGYAKDKDGELTTVWGGHSVVADGYGFVETAGAEPTAYVHVNLGWGGTDDAWYNIPEIDTASVGALVDDQSGYDFMYLGSATFNISTDAEEAGKAILSGRITDLDGRPFTNAVVRVFGGDGTDLHVTPDTNGIYVAFVPGGTNYDVRAQSGRIGEVPELIGWVDAPVFVGRTTADDDRVVKSAAEVGNRWGVDLTMAPPAVRFDGNDRKVYPNLDRALAEADEGTRLEILRSTTLANDYLLTKELTIVATNDDPQASQIVRQGGARLQIDDGGDVLFTNVAFRADISKPSVEVGTDGVMRVAGIAIFDDIVSGVPGVLVHDADGFVLVGRLDSGITLECDKASKAGDAFGRWTCDYEDATNSAVRIVSRYGVGSNRAGKVAGEMDDRLVWQDDVPVDPAVAVAYVDADSPVYYRTLDQLFDAHAAGTNVVITRSGVMLSKSLTLSGVQSIAAADDVDEVIVHPSGTAGFIVPAACDLTVSGITFEDYSGEGLFKVNGEDAALTLTNCVFRRINGTVTDWPGSGAVSVSKGRVKSIESTFVDCSTKGNGGAIYLKGAGCELELLGGSITECHAENYGGGVYAGVGSSVFLGGDLAVNGNTYTENLNAPAASDIYLVNSINGRADLSLVDEFSDTASVGLKYSGTSGGFGNKVGNRFMALGPAETIPASTVSAFFNDNDPSGIVPAQDGASLIWENWEPSDNKLDPANPSDMAKAVVALIDRTQAVTDYYARVEHAFAAATPGATAALLKDVRFDADLTNACELVLTSMSPDRFTLTRRGDVTIHVRPGTSLTVTNLVIHGGDGSVCLIRDERGALTLGADAVLTDVIGTKNRAAGAVTVVNGTLTMENGAEIRNCVKSFYDAGTAAGYGGAVLAENNATVWLKGCVITNCVANRGGGIFVGSDSKVFVSGDLTITGNHDLDGQDDNMCISDTTQMSLLLTGDSALTGAVGYNEGVSASREVFGKVGPDFSGTDEDALLSAHCFRHDVTGDIGLAVTGGGETLLVWGSALKADGTFKWKDPTITYNLVDGAKVKVNVPVAVEPPPVYDGTAQVGVPEGVGYFITDNVATNAGNYTAHATPRPGFAWTEPDGSTDTTNITWSIAKAVYDIKGEGVVFMDRTFEYDGFPKTNHVSGLPEGFTVEYTGDIRWDPGTNEVTATISGELPNYCLDPDPTVWTRKLIIVDPNGLYKPPKPVVDPDPSGRAEPDPIAFKSIAGDLTAGTWTLVVTQIVEKCWYSLYETNSLVGGFKIEGVEPVWTKQPESGEFPEWTITRPNNGTQLFWRMVAEPEDAH